MENKGLLFIPDISGFSRFVHETEINHSRLIIQELLEILINANQIDLKVSEIEGDAILFYKFGEPPQLADIYHQVEKMFTEFHRSIVSYEHRRYCQCKACMSAVDLTLKIITHYGEFAGYSVKNFNKLIGKDVIVAHQLLKNDIDVHEYWLVTQDLLKDGVPENFAEWMEWNNSIKETESGKVKFKYTKLTALKNELPPDPPLKSSLDNKTRLVSVSKEYSTDIITLFHAAGSFQYRHQWMDGVQRVEELNHFLPRVGMRCRCIMEDGIVNTYSSSYHYEDTRIEFSETDDQTDHTINFIIDKLGRGKAKLTLDFYFGGNSIQKFFFTLSGKNKLRDRLQKSLDNLDGLAKTLKIPTADYT
jgi:hypothetical protein